MSNLASPMSVSVLICTRDRPTSLRQTLASLAKADQSEVRSEVIVVDNGDSVETAEVVKAYQRQLAVKHIREKEVGKGHALNRALADCRVGQVVAIIDDDISVHENWFRGVRAVCERWPQKGFYSGRTEIEWPYPNVPAWAKDPWLRGWAFSVMTPEYDREVPTDRWVPGGHFWFWTKLIPAGYRFSTDWLTEPKFMLDLAERGYGGVICADALAVHRIQPALLNTEVLTKRATLVGRAFAEARLVPYRSTIKQAVLFKQHPLLARVFCHLNALRWNAVGALTSFAFSPDKRLLRQWRALERTSTYREYLRICAQHAEYRVGLRASV